MVRAKAFERQSERKKRNYEGVGFVKHVGFKPRV